MAETVCIVGLGYVGLPLACLCAEKGLRVNAFDLDKSIVEKTNRGVSHIKDNDLESRLGKLKGKINASSSPEILKNADTILVCVPTPAIGQKPDLQPLKKASETIAGFLRKGQLVIIESTVYPGTIEEVVKPILESRSKLKAGKDFFLVHCPERIDPGNKEFTLERIPRVLGAMSKGGEKRALVFYRGILDAEILVLSGLKSAEAVKVVENTFRDVNIAFVNELAKSFDRLGIDLSEVLGAASTKPFGFMAFQPGPGVGGHCISQDPYYLIARAEKAGFKHSFLSLARSINESMPAYAVQLTESTLKSIGLQLKGAKIVVLGLAYKPDVPDTRKSPALEILELLKRAGADTVAFDPWVKAKSTVGSLDQALANADVVLLATHHSLFLDSLKPGFLKGKGVKAVIDCRNVLDMQGIKDIGIAYKGIGR